jgi:hypothetical protein
MYKNISFVTISLNFAVVSATWLLWSNCVYTIYATFTITPTLRHTSRAFFYAEFDPIVIFALFSKHTVHQHNYT